MTHLRVSVVNSGIYLPDQVEMDGRVETLPNLALSTNHAHFSQHLQPS